MHIPIPKDFMLIFAQRKLAIAMVSLACLVYYVHEPVPEGLMGSDRPTIQMMSDLYRFLGITTKLCIWMASTKYFVFALRLQTQAWLLIAPHPRSDNITVKDMFIANVPVRVYAPVDNHRLGQGAMVYAHGGGWFLGDVDLSHAETFEIARRLRKLIVSVDYRRSPEHAFPAALDDFEAVVRQVLRTGRVGEWPVDRAEVAVAGVSSGGNLAASAAHRLLDRPEELPLKLQLLIYPVLQMTNFQLPSYRQGHEYIETGLLNPGQMARVFLTYLNVSLKYEPILLANAHIHPQLEFDSAHCLLNISSLPTEYIDSPINNSHKFSLPPIQESFSEAEIVHVQNKLRPYVLNPELNPIYRPNLVGLPHTYMITAGYDVLRDECTIYTNRLKKAGVPVTWEHYHDANHGVFSIFDLEHGDLMLGEFVHFAQDHMN